MHSSRGSTRVLLVAVLTAAAVLLVASVVALMGAGGDDGLDDDTGTARFVPSGESGRGVRDRTRVGEDGEDGEDDEIYDWEVGSGSRDPHGPEFVVTSDSLRNVLADRHWEEIRRQISILQENGGEVPMDVVTALLALLDGDDTRIDAVLALGGVTSDAAGQALAELATNLTAAPEARAAALDALARNGSRAALTAVQTLVAAPTTDQALLRHACPALAGIGGQDAARTLLDLLTKHQDSNLEGMIVQALGTTRGAGDVVAQAIRQARDSSDGETALLMVRVARMSGPDADDAVRLEVRRLVEDPTALEFAADEATRLKLRGGALTAAAAIGGDLLDPVVRIVRDDTDGWGSVAMHCLRKARGDEAVEKVAPLLEARPDPAFQREVTVVLGETRSFQATPHLVRQLESEDQNTRHAAAQGLSLVRDPAATKPLLRALDDVGDDFAMARSVVEALGRIGANDALDRLRALKDSDETFWEGLRPWVRNAIERIESGNPDSTRMD